MRALIQRVSKASVIVDGTVVGSIGPGLLILLGVKQGDTGEDADYLAGRCIALRVFSDTEGMMNLSVEDTGGSVLVVSQFTLYGDTRKGNRPSYTDAAPPAEAEALYTRFADVIARRLGEGRVARGVFRAMMNVELVNDGPVTLIVESKPKPGTAS